jgi:hypothetical protein
VPLDRRSFVQGSALLGAGMLAVGATGGKSMPKSNELYPDPLFTTPFIDKDEWRDDPVRHRYVHGGFEGTDLLFSMYFPPQEQYQGRFFHPLMHIAGNENMAYHGRLAGLDGDSIPFAFASGGYLVESNMGSFKMLGEPSVTSFRASAATAQYGRILAEQMYGEHRPYGYVYGGSGGSYKTFACVENTQGVWDGAVPFIHPCPVAMPNVFSAQAMAFRVLDGKWDQIVDALEPGGSGDMYAGLNDEERSALREITRMGFPPRAWFAHERLSMNYTAVFGSIITTLFHEDPGYFQDFWKLPGYQGTNPPPSLLDTRVQMKTTLTGLVSTAEAHKLGLPVGIAAGTRETAPAGIRVAEMPRSKHVQGTFIYPRTGTGVGQRLMITGVVGDIIMIGFDGENIPALEAMRPGDQLDIDNSDYLAVQTYHRHQNPSPEYKVWDQFRDASGKPIYPQRPLMTEYNQVGKGNAWQSGRFDCKMITVNCLMDEAAWPWMVDWYRTKVKGVLGDRFEDQYRVWYLDRAMHVNPSRYLSPAEGAVFDEHHSTADTHIVSYAGVLQQALRDVAAWAEKGIAPPQETAYSYDEGQIHVPARASDRHGIQPTVDLTADGGPRADVEVGQKVEFVGTIEVPQGAGGIAKAEWDYDGTGEYRVSEDFTDAATTKTVRQSHAFDKPGTHFVALRVTVQRDDAAGTPFARVLNLARARVVVT